MTLMLSIHCPSNMNRMLYHYTEKSCNRKSFLYSTFCRTETICRTCTAESTVQEQFVVPVWQKAPYRKYDFSQCFFTTVLQMQYRGSVELQSVVCINSFRSTQLNSNSFNFFATQLNSTRSHFLKCSTQLNSTHQNCNSTQLNSFLGGICLLFNLNFFRKHIYHDCLYHKMWQSHH